jgi:hypothetical protein
MFFSRCCLLIHQREVRTRGNDGLAGSTMTLTATTRRHLVVHDWAEASYDAHAKLRFEEGSSN